MYSSHSRARRHHHIQSSDSAQLTVVCRAQQTSESYSNKYEMYQHSRQKTGGTSGTKCPSVLGVSVCHQLVYMSSVCPSQALQVTVQSSAELISI